MNIVEIGKVDYTRAGSNCKILLGDLNKDGRMEIVCIQANGQIDDRYEPHQVTCVTVFDMEGNMLWQYGKPVDHPGNFGSDFPAQVYDLDQDGNLEVLCIMDKKFLVLNGLTGEVKNIYDLPGPMAHDCIIIANLRGLNHPSDIILKDRYQRLWALDDQFNLLWTHEGNVGHFPYVFDINGDGYDEVMAGYDLLDHKGKLLWSCKDLEDHADCLWIGDVNGDGHNEIVVGGSVTCLYDKDGNELWRNEDSVESQHIALGKFIKDEPGLQIAGLDRIRRGDGHKGEWDGLDGLFLLSSEGQCLWEEKRTSKGWLTIINTCRNWGGCGQDHILAYRRGGGELPGLYDGRMKKVLTFPVDGYVILADLFGRGVTDGLVYDGQCVYIYANTRMDIKTLRGPKPLEQTKKLYATTLYPGSEYI